eukprot:Tbor_TRINITY_DN5983_c1_g1::TRINITY_DN5983_c1_g1_i1::g.18647::m.18647/K20347/TMED2, EMP24; p24 family protein beta-1
MQLVSWTFVALVLLTVADATSVRIDAGEEQCYSHRFPRNSKGGFSFAVSHGSPITVGVKVTYSYLTQTNDHITGNFRPHSQIIRQWNAASDGTLIHDISSDSQFLEHVIEACISNDHSTWSPVWVAFQFNVHEMMEFDEGHHASAESDRAVKIHASGSRLFDIVNELETVKGVVQRHRKVVEATYSWVSWGSAISALMLIGMACFQYWYLTKFLSTRGAVGML